MKFLNFKSYLQMQPLRFLLVGGFNTIISYILFLITTALFNYRAALILTYIAGINISIISMRYLVFKSNVPLRQQYLKAALSYILLLAGNYAALYWLIDIMLFRPWLAQAIFTIISTVLLYFLHKEINFKNRP